MTLKRLFIAIALVALTHSTAFSQGVVIRAVGSADGEGGQAQPIEAFSFSLDGSQPAFFGGGDLSLFGGDPLNMLQQAQFADELTILDDQQKELKALAKEVRKMQSAVFSKLRDPSGRLNMEALRGEMETMREAVRAKTKEGLDKILLPAQRERFEEIRTQLELQRGGLGAVQGNRLADLIGLTDEQKKELKEKQGDYQKRLQKGIEELKQKLQEQILGEVLTKKQLNKLTQLQGDRFELKRKSFQEQIQELRQRAEERKKDDDKD